MRLSKIKIVNFRNHSSTELDLSKKVNLIIGPNASGKSSIVDAIAFLFTGINSRTAKSGEGMNEVVTFGESRALVGAEIEGLGKITRSIPHDLQIADWEGTMTAQTDRFYEKFGISKEGMLCSAYSTKFLDMSPDEQKNFMFSLMGLKLNNDLVMREFASWCKENNVKNGKGIWDYIVKEFTFTGSPGDFDGVYKTCAGSRRILKRELKQFETLSKGIESKLPEGVSIEHKDSVISKLGELRAKRDELFIKLGNAKSQQKLKIDFEEKIAKEKTIKIPEESQETLKEKSRESEEEKVKISNSIAKYGSEIKNIESTLDKLSKFDGKCPLCEEIACKLTDDDIKKIVDGLLVKKDRRETKLKAEMEEMDKVKKKWDDLNKVLEQRIKADIMLPEIENAKKQLEELNKKETLDIAILGDEIRKLDERITNGQTILTSIEAEISNEKRRIEAKRDFEKKQNELKFIEIIIEAFGPKGLKSTLLNKAMKPIEGKANEKLKVLTDGEYSVNFRIDEDNFNIYIISGGVERRIKHLSTSERLRIGIIMQDAINELVGSKILVVDDVDILDKNNRRLFWNLIDRIKENYDTIMVMATGTEAKGGNGEIGTYMLGKKAKSDVF